MTRANRPIGGAVALVAAASVAALLSGSSASAQPTDETKQQCVSAYQSAQELKLDGKLSAAREKAAFCSREQCPGAVRDGCTKWMAEIMEIQPSITVTAHGEGGKDLSDVRVLIDGKPAVESLTGRPIDIDPGKHTLRFEHGALPPIEREIIISEGAKNRAVPVDFAPPAPPGSATPGGGKPPGGDKVVPVEPPSMVGPIVVGAVGVAALGIFAVLAAKGSSDVSDMRSSCGVTHSCPQDRIDSARTQLQIGDVFLGLGVVGVGAGIGWYVARRPGEPSTTGGAKSVRVSVAPQRGGAATSMTVGF
jgi:hypothetical protein